MIRRDYSEAFEFAKNNSAWRIAVLRKPLYDVLYKQYSSKEQVEAIQTAMIEAINIYIEAMK